VAMGKEFLMELFLVEMISDLQLVIFEIGVKGLLRDFEIWLEVEQAIDGKIKRNLLKGNGINENN
jgi:hypothetical protein